jgi:hypothetical protein
LAGRKEQSTEERLKALAKRIEELEAKLRGESMVLDEVMKELRLLRDISLASAFVMNAASKIRGYKYDDISRHIVDALLRAGPMNISQLTKFLRDVRGTASRRIVSEKVRLLSSLGLVEEVAGEKREKRYKIKKLR